MPRVPPAFLDLIGWTITGDNYKPWSSSLRSLAGINMFLIALFPTPSGYVLRLISKTKFHARVEEKYRKYARIKVVVLRDPNVTVQSQ